MKPITTALKKIRGSPGAIRSRAQTTLPSLPPKDLRCSKWSIVAEMKLTLSQEALDWEIVQRIAGVHRDEYTGNPYFRPIIETFYWLMLIHTKKDNTQITNSTTYSSVFTELVSVHHNIPLVSNQDFSYSYCTSGIHRHTTFTIQFRVKFTPTVRRTEDLGFFLERKPFYWSDGPDVIQVLKMEGLHIALCGDLLVIIDPEKN
ncbi:putative matrix protein [Hubei dimarhabdovirus 1]|uniref:Putative matrix protein n=1 Tax=Hubei dimarhabdovirus 1 TaxID=2849739 RepID=A0A1L3KMX7_9RHAB|nr:putative matrix protein [Hubei dimarhabdovirus 1]APG78742.1 putative matrix protein [Hubei dimarhabdovirus 1]